MHVFERNAEGVTFGWGVVFSDQTVENLMANDPVSGQIISDEFAHWDDIDVHIHGSCVRSSGHGFIGIGRKRLLEILATRARDLGVVIHYEHECQPDLAAWEGWDVVIAADGINSRFRDAYSAHFGVDVQERANRFVWLGTPKTFDAFTFAFEKTDAGWIWAHAYRFADDCSTFIVECSEETWTGLGFDQMDQAEAIELCERIFAKYLDGSAAAHQCRTSSGFGRLAEISKDHLRALALRSADPAWRRGPYRPLFDRIRNQARAGRCDQAGRGAKSPRR